MIHAMTRTRPVALATSLALALSGTLLLVAPQGAEARPRAARAPAAQDDGGPNTYLSTPPDLLGV